MNTKSLSRLAKRFLRFLSRNKAPIMIATGLCMGAGAIVETAKVAPVAKQKLDEKKEELGVDKLTVGETIRTAGPIYIPAIAMSATSAGFIIGGTASSIRQNAAIAAACAMSENALKEYKQSVIETVGEKKEQLISENVAQKKVEALPPAKPDLLIAGQGLIRCIDTFTGQEFIGDVGKIKQAVSELNYELTTQSMYVTLNEYQEALGMKSTKAGDILGWNIDDGVITVSFTSALSVDNVPCLAVTVYPEPKQSYMNY